jgi:PAS domain-containing protein
VERSVSRALARPLDVAGALRIVHAEMSRVLDVTICFFGVYDAPGQSVEVVWQVHDGRELPGGHFPLGSGFTSQAIRECRPKLIRRWSREGPSVQVQYATDRPDLPESSIAAPVVFDGEVIGVLVVQSYQADAYDEDDVALVQGIADQLALTISDTRPRPESSTDGPIRGADLEAVLASMPDALLVLDEQSRLVRLNQAARRLLCLTDGTLILGHPVDRPQADHWPLGTRELTDQLRPVVDQLRRGDEPHGEVQVALNNSVEHTLSCRASVLLKDGSPAGGLMVLREVA